MKKRGRYFVSMLLVCLSIMGILGSLKEAQAKPKELVVPVITDVTGPYALSVTPMVYGIKDTEKYVNEVLGGIDGVPLKFDIMDTGGEMARCISAYNLASGRSPRPPLMVCYISGATETLKERINEDKICWYGSTNNPALSPPGYVFSWRPAYPDMFAAIMDWAIATDWRGPGKPKLGILTYDSAFGKAMLTPETIEYMKRKGVEYLGIEYHGGTATDVTSQLARFKERGINYLNTHALVGIGSLILKDLDRLGMKNVKVLGSCESSLSEDLIKLAGDLGTRMYAGQYYRQLVEENTTGIKLVNKIYKAGNTSEKYFNGSYIFGVDNVFCNYVALKRAVEKVGWEKLDSRAVKEAFETMNNLDLFDLSIKTYTKDRHSPTKIKIWTVRNGKLFSLTPQWLECPDLVPPGTVLD